MEFTYHGHSCVQITDGDHSIIIDPFLTGNPIARTKADDIRVQYVLLTHGHPDHIADAEQIARNNDATIITAYELAIYYGWKGLKTIGMNIGGALKTEFAEVKMVRADHSSGIIVEEERQIVYAGTPGGFIIKRGGLTILHAGDTALFEDMKLIGSQHEIDYAFLPIGDVFTMGPEDAVTAAEWFKAKTVIPVHHNTFPPIVQDENAFLAALKERHIGGIALAPGESHRIS